MEQAPWAVLWRHRLSSQCMVRRGRLLYIIRVSPRKCPKAVTIANIQGFLRR